MFNENLENLEYSENPINIGSVKNKWKELLDSKADLSTERIIEIRNSLEKIETSDTTLKKEIEETLKKFLFTKARMSLVEFKDFWEQLERLVNLGDGDWLTKIVILENKDFKNIVKNIRSEIGDSTEMIRLLEKINELYKDQKIHVPPMASLNPEDVIKGVKILNGRRKMESISPALENDIIDKIISVRIKEKNNQADLWIYTLLTTTEDEVNGYYHEGKVERKKLKKKYINELCSNEDMKDYRDEYFSRLENLFIEFSALEKEKSNYKEEIKALRDEKVEVELKIKSQNELSAQIECMKDELSYQLAKNAKMDTYLNERIAQSQLLYGENAELTQAIEDMKSDLQIARERAKELEEKPETEYTIRILSKFIKSSSKHLKELAMFAADFKDSQDETISMFEYTIQELFSDMKNAGIHITGNIGEIVKFDPKEHESLGGAKPENDESVIIEIPGWKVGDLKSKMETVEKAIVKKMEESNNG